MKQEIKIKEGNQYIIVFDKGHRLPAYIRVEVLEVTDTTYFFKNLDEYNTFRIGVSDFNNNHEVVELVQDVEEESKALKKDYTKT